MALILNIETATTNCSISLSQNGEILVLKEDHTKGYSHAEVLHVFIDEVLKTANILPKQLSAIAVSKGPGSYTGLRIGVSAAKGLCYALNIPLIAINTLHSLAYKAQANSGYIIPMLDARRMEVYASVYDYKFQLTKPTKAIVLEEDSFLEFLEKDKVYFVGNGVAKTKTIINHPNAIFIEDKLPSAKETAQLAAHKYKIGNFEDVAYFEPYYLKDFIALKPKPKV